MLIFCLEIIFLRSLDGYHLEDHVPSTVTGQERCNAQARCPTPRALVLPVGSVSPSVNWDQTVTVQWSGMYTTV